MKCLWLQILFHESNRDLEIRTDRRTDKQMVIRLTDKQIVIRLTDKQIVIRLTDKHIDRDKHND